MIIPIKQALLEGYNIEAITEMAVHANHSHLNKRNLENTAAERINLAKDILDHRRTRDDYRSNIRNFSKIESNVPVDPKTSLTQKQLNQRRANLFDNKARSISQTGGLFNRSKFVGGVFNRPIEDKTSIGKLFGLPNYVSEDEAHKKNLMKPRLISSAKQ